MCGNDYIRKWKGQNGHKADRGKQNMKKDRKSVENRQTRILNLIREKGQVTVEELAETFDVSLMTVRRDLTLLEEQELINRYYGGATIRDFKHALNPQDRIAMCKSMIAEYASRFLEDGDTIFINGSSTALKMLEYAGSKTINVYTNNINAMKTEYPKNVKIHMTGGEVRGHVMIGDYVMSNLLSMHADKTFIGCAGVYDDGEFRYDIPTEIGINEAMIARTRKDLFILADHTKIQPRLSQENLYGSCIYDRQLTLITDDLADAACIDNIKATGISVVQINTMKAEAAI